MSESIDFAAPKVVRRARARAFSHRGMPANVDAPRVRSMSWPGARNDVETPSARAIMSPQYAPNPQRIFSGREIGNEFASLQGRRHRLVDSVRSANSLRRDGSLSRATAISSSAARTTSRQARPHPRVAPADTAEIYGSSARATLSDGGLAFFSKYVRSTSRASCGALICQLGVFTTRVEIATSGASAGAKPTNHV
jgi:hypothetical protein